MSRNDSEGRYFFISAPLGSMLTTEGMWGRDGSSEGIPNQFVSSAAEGLIAVCSMKKRECSGDWRDSCDRFTGGIWESIPGLGSHSHPERWPHTSHPSAGISTPTHLDSFRMCSLNTSALYRNTSASAHIGQKHSFFWVRQQEGKMFWNHLQSLGQFTHRSLEITTVLDFTLLDHQMSVWTLLTECPE